MFWGPNTMPKSMFQPVFQTGVLEIRTVESGQILYMGIGMVPLYEGER